ncbi:hypothetical protein M9Y10_036471 [Tritrichomonas musculus]|uniref:Protein kinase domain-containing protein n=1 Tax=Tritrichomonas musculus TaxID=1915356 RepID=A0ABR2GU62_9EUKA
MDLEGVFFNAADYELEKKKLGEGAFGTVYVAKNLIDNKQYAAKLIRCSEGMSGYQQMLFLRESLTLNKLDHPSIVKFKGVNFQSLLDPTLLQPAIITEFLPHGSLKYNLNKEKKSLADSNWTSTKKYIMLLGIADAMRYLHAHGIIHRDLKPENILVDEDYYPRVCDFGLSRCFSDSLTKSQNLTMTGEIGTPLYMAPELLRGEDCYSTSVDVYAFSILAYEIVTGEEPFSELGEKISPFGFAHKVINGHRPKLSGCVSEKMKNLLMRCWSENPEDRPSFDDIFSELSDISYFDETVDDEEVHSFLDILEDAKRRDCEGDSKDEVFNLRRRMKKTSEEKETLSKEISELKRSLKKLGNEVATYKSSQDDFIESLHSLHGSKREKNYNMALMFLNRSSAGGNMNSSYLLGLLYENGEGVKQDFEQAKKCYEKSSEQGNSHGYNRIGFCYKNGLGTETDYLKAVEYYRKGSDLGNKFSINNLGFCYGQGRGVKQDYSKAFECYKKGAELGNSDSYNNLGLCYDEGRGVNQDYSKAFECYKKGAELGNPNSLNWLGIYYDEGRGVKQDHSKAFECYQKSADLGNAGGLYDLADCYERGVGVKKDLSKAIEYYQKSADLGFEDAQEAIERLRNKK